MRIPDGDIGRGGVGRCDAGTLFGVGGMLAGALSGWGNTMFEALAFGAGGICVGSMKNVLRRPRIIRYKPVNPITIAPISDM